MMNAAVDLPALTDIGGDVRHQGGRDAMTIRVGLTEAHGMAKEVSQFPADGVEYSFRHQSDDVDLVEAVLSPVRTTSRWVYSLAHLAEGCGFEEAGTARPRAERVASLMQLLTSPNFKKLIFWSNAGYATLGGYGGIDPSELAGKVTVVYPAVRRVPDALIGYRNRDLRLLFSGEFFRKGGVHVVDAFARARKRYPGISLTVCCDERNDFKTPDRSLRTEYLNKVNTLPGIISKGRIDRDQLLNEIYPTTDILLVPSYVETFGMAILEAMAFGIPVISTNHFAIPEMIQNGVNGVLVDTRRFHCDQLFPGYTVPSIPSEFREYMTDAVFTEMCRLIESFELRKSIGQAALNVARTKFTFERRNKAVLDIYREALAD